MFRSPRPLVDETGRRLHRSVASRLSRQRRQRRVALEWLEDRTLLSTYPVTSASDSSNPSSGMLRWAVQQANANPGSSIEFELGTGATTITLSSGQLELKKSVTIYDGSGEGPVTVSGNAQSRIFQIDSGVMATISGITITDGNATRTGGSGRGGGLVNYGNAYLTNCTISGSSSASSGGGLENYGNAMLTGCTISGNYAAARGGGLANYFSITNGSSNAARLILSNCTITGNSASGTGGGLYTNGIITDLTDCTIWNNSAAAGGGVANDGMTVNLTDCTVSGNSGSGGGLFGLSSASWSLYSTIVAGNTQSGSGANDITDQATSEVMGSYNLIGDGGSGGISNGSNHNIVLTTQTENELRLGPLGSYGGPTETLPLLVGSAAIGAGTSSFPNPDLIITTDQRGLPLDSPEPDIGAFQIQHGTLRNQLHTRVTRPDQLADLFRRRDLERPRTSGVVVRRRCPDADRDDRQRRL